MGRFEKLIRMNLMLLANFLANCVGVFWVTTLIFLVEEPPPAHIWEEPWPKFIQEVFNPLAFTFVLIASLIYERPIRRYLDAVFDRKNVSASLRQTALRRLLNEPFVLIGFDFAMWLLAAVVFAAIHWTHGSDDFFIYRSLYQSITTGLITVTVAFFLLEHVMQKRLLPLAFPEGGFATVPDTLRIRIRTRLMALVLACNLIPLVSIIVIFYRTIGIAQDPNTSIAALEATILSHAVLYIITGVFLTILVSRNLSIPFKGIIQTLYEIRHGRFNQRVQVVSNDEIGYTGDAINEMTAGLIERDRMRQSLNLAREVQQNLLPQTGLKQHGYEICGKSIFCDETGGDYFDFIVENGRIGVAIGDVSGHGIPSALLMATVRAYLRQRFSLGGSVAAMLTDVNHQLTHDVEESGQFMTLFFLAIDTAGGRIEWVRAGHDAALCYDPVTDRFDELGGEGIALGVDEQRVYKDQARIDLLPGQVIVLFTDGIFETRNPAGEMFGKQRLYSAIRSAASSTAGQIRDHISDSLTEFQQDARVEDDITLVVVKRSASD